MIGYGQKNYFKKKNTGKGKWSVQRYMSALE